EPATLTAAERARLRRVAQEAGIVVSGLHWLLARPAGLSITSADARVRRRTADVLRALVDLCADLGGSVLVHGSPAQRRLPDDDDDAPAARERAIELIASTAAHAAGAGLMYCIEPLAPPEANFIHTLQEAADIVRTIGCPALRTMIDCCAAARAEASPPAQLLEQWLPTGLVAHVQVNDPNLRGPGQGALRFGPVFAALRRHRYGGWVSVEPFEYRPDGPACAARAIGYVRGVLDGLA
ncbi:MAG: sugar phosphate isomerase/epimerase family protein, partial [Betaproteobacteria bacterium]